MPGPFELQIFADHHGINVYVFDMIEIDICAPAVFVTNHRNLKWIFKPLVEGWFQRTGYGSWVSMEIIWRPLNSAR